MSKIKSKNGTPEVHSARSKLDGLLQTLVTKKEDSPPEKPDSDDTDDYLTSTPHKGRAGGPKHARKRKRGKDESAASPDIGQYHHTYVMKLFDRSVDLAQFEEDSSLYPICRAWMRNQPHNRNLAPQDRCPTPEPETPILFNEEEDIYQLPSPVPVKTERDVDLRIPDPLLQPDEHLDIHADPDLAPAPEQILLNHMVRWKQVRQRWKDSGFRNESRFAASMEILRNMYDRQCKE